MRTVRINEKFKAQTLNMLYEYLPRNTFKEMWNTFIIPLIHNKDLTPNDLQDDVFSYTSVKKAEQLKSDDTIQIFFDDEYNMSGTPKDSKWVFTIHKDKIGEHSDEYKKKKKRSEIRHQPGDYPKVLIDAVNTALNDSNYSPLVKYILSINPLLTLFRTDRVVLPTPEELEDPNILRRIHAMANFNKQRAFAKTQAKRNPEFRGAEDLIISLYKDFIATTSKTLSYERWNTKLKSIQDSIEILREDIYDIFDNSDTINIYRLLNRSFSYDTGTTAESLNKIALLFYQTVRPFLDPMKYQKTFENKKVKNFRDYVLMKESEQYTKSDFCRIELKCLDLEMAPELEEETKEQWEVAFNICDNLGATYRSEEGYPNGDAYLYPGSENLFKILDQLDENGVVYDNIDLPDDAPKKIIDTLVRRYKNTLGVSVNLNSFP